MKHVLQILLTVLIVWISCPALAEDVKEQKPPTEVQTPPAENTTENKASGQENADKEKAPPTYRPCTESDLLSTIWKLVVLREEPEGQELRSYKVDNFRYLAFYKDRRMVKIIQHKEIMSADAIKNLIIVNLAKGKLLYTLDEKGNLFIYLDQQPISTFSCYIMTAELPGYKKGDMALSGLSKNKNKEFQLYRHF